VMSRHISSRGLKVVLNGDGSDELFGGYSFFASDRLLADDEYRATSFQQATTEQRKSAQRKHAGSANWFGAETALDEEQSPYAKALGLPSAFSKLAVTIHHDWLPQELRELGDPFEAIHEMFTPKEIEEMAKLHPMHRGMWAWQKTMLPNVVIASISDGAEMGEYFHHWLLSYGGKLTKENKHILSKVDHHSLTTSLLSSRRLSHQTR
jgi:asparagine synthase (glutamine-hydrolysing)